MSGGSLGALAILIVAFLFLVLEASAEAGVISLSRSRARLLLDREPESATAQQLNRIVQGRERAMGSFAIGRTLAVVTGLVAGLYVIIVEFGFGWLEVLAAGLVGFVVIAGSQAVPRRVATLSPEGFGLRLATTMRRLESLFLIPAALFEAPAFIATRLLRLEARHPHAPEALEILLEREEAGNGIEEEEREMIRGIIEIGETVVREAMVPRPDIIAVEINHSLRETAQVAVDRGVSRLPVYEESIDNIVGVLYAKDALARLLVAEDVPIRQILRPPVFVPESKRVDELLAEIRKSHVHMAIVVDEYGGTAGLVTIEDLLEEIVGEIEDEYDRNPSSIIRVSDDEAVVEGRASLDTLMDLFACHIESDDFDTVGGLLFDRLGKIPEPGDKLTADGLQLSVLSMEGRRIGKVRVRRINLASEPKRDESRSAS